MADLQPSDRTAITDFLVQRFSLDEIKALAFNLGIDYENFPHDSKPTLSRELFTYCERTSQVGCLLTEVLKERADGAMGQLLANVGGCAPRKKVQIIISENKIASKPELLANLAQLLGVSPDEVMLIGAAPGSIYLLVSLPAEAADELVHLQPKRLVDGKYHVQAITPFDALPLGMQQDWRSIAQRAQGGSAGGDMAVKAATEAGKQSLAVPGQAIVVSTTGAALGLPATMLFIAAVVIAVAVVAAGGLALATPKVTVRNGCTTALPPTGSLPLIGSVPAGGTVGPVVIPPGRYQLKRGARDITLIVPNTPALTFPDVSGGQFAVTRNGQPVGQAELESGFDVALGQSYEIVLCGP
jgi:hypothetical protein